MAAAEEGKGLGSRDAHDSRFKQRIGRSETIGAIS